ncbi:prepilin-type N-terminal cleavage/methylation domain-containing protein [Candidatus Omnitrophota bacterium]
MQRKGFTLLEVLIVVIIIGILAAIALPQYTSTLEKAKSAEAIGILGSFRNSMDRYWYEHLSDATYTSATFAMGATGTITLDLDNPNDTTNKKWQYGLTDNSTSAARDYLIQAQRLTKETTHWIDIDEDGNIAKSKALGGTDTHLN